MSSRAERAVNEVIYGQLAVIIAVREVQRAGGRLAMARRWSDRSPVPAQHLASLENDLDAARENLRLVKASRQLEYSA